jgi:hypothetical protein
LASFLDDVVGTLGNARRRRWCETYVRGVLLDGRRKSIEPMAARLWKIESGAEDYEQALQQFINQSPWDEQAVLDGLQRWIGGKFGTEGYLIPRRYGLSEARDVFGRCGAAIHRNARQGRKLPSRRDAADGDAARSRRAVSCCGEDRGQDDPSSRAHLSSRFQAWYREGDKRMTRSSARNGRAERERSMARSSERLLPPSGSRI